MKSRKLALLLAIALTAPVVTLVGAADLTTSTVPAQMQAAGGYLGVMLGPVPDALRAQIGGVLPSGQGVMIHSVQDDSPAAKAGLKTYDILIGFNDQKLFSAEQLSHLVRAASPNTAVTLRVVRGGAVLDTQVMLGEVQAESDSAFPGRGMSMHRPHSRAYVQRPGAAVGNWESFDSMSLKKLEDGNYKAEIQYLGKDGKIEKQEFTGTRDAIREQILKQKDLPSAERDQLLDALSARDDFFPSIDWFGPRFNLPQWFNRQPDF
jgi:membrane-associated protease RseP (regulator of RpoE activity)